MSVAVISTCFNQADLIGECIESVQRQTTSETVHHIVCDDGSEDNSIEVLCRSQACAFCP